MSQNLNINKFLHDNKNKNTIENKTEINNIILDQNISKNNKANKKKINKIKKIDYSDDEESEYKFSEENLSGFTFKNTFLKFF